MPAQRRRLIIRPGAIGDVIVSLPALEWLAADASYTEVWAPSATAPLIQFAHCVRPLSSTQIDLVELGLASEAMFRGFDDIVSWYGTGRDEFRHAVREFPFRFFPALPAEGVALHATDFYLSQVGAPLGAAPRIAAIASAQGHLALHPYSGSARKNWPIERFRQLSDRLPFVWCDQRFARLDELAAWLTGARAYVGNDSGITHLAAAVGAPTVVLFGPTDPNVWAPRGSRVIRRETIDAISVDEVYQAVVDCMR